MTTLRAQGVEAADRQKFLVKRLRIDQTRQGLEQLGAEIKAWACKRHKADQVRQYFTQLNTLSGVLENALLRVRPELDALATAAHYLDFAGAVHTISALFGSGDYGSTSATNSTSAMETDLSLSPGVRCRRRGPECRRNAQWHEAANPAYLRGCGASCP